MSGALYNCYIGSSELSELYLTKTALAFQDIIQTNTAVQLPVDVTIPSFDTHLWHFLIMEFQTNPADKKNKPTKETTCSRVPVPKEDCITLCILFLLTEDRETRYEYALGFSLNIYICATLTLELS